MERVKHHHVLLKTLCDCNFNCKYCFDKSVRERYAGMRMDLSIVEHVFRIESQYAEEISVDLFGGEPTLQSLDYYRKIMEILASNYLSTYNVSIQSNGLIPAKHPQEWLDFLEETGASLDFSYDFTTQDVRGVSFQTELLDLSRRIREQHLRGGGFISVMNSENIDKLYDLKLLVKNLGIDMHDFNIQTNQSIVEGKSVGIPLDDYDKYYFDYLTKYLRFSEDTSGNFDRGASTYIGALLGVNAKCCDYSDCTKSWFSILPDGTISCCTKPTVEILDTYQIGKIQDFDSVEAIYNSQGYRKYIQDVNKRLEYCNQCKFVNFCKGGCNTQHSLKHNGDVSEVDTGLCDLLKRNLFNAYLALQDVNLDETLNPSFVQYVIGQRCVLPAEVVGFLKQSNLASDSFNLRLSREDYNDGNYIVSAKVKLFLLFNHALQRSNIRIPVYDRDTKVLNLYLQQRYEALMDVYLANESEITKLSDTIEEE